MLTLKELRDRRAQVVQQGVAVVTGYQTEGREPTESELGLLGELATERTSLEDQIVSAEDRQDLERGFTAVVGGIAVGADRATLDPTRGFANLGEFAIAVRGANPASGGAQFDERLRLGAAPTTFGSEAVGADGGFLVPTQFATTIWEHSLEEDAFLPLTDQTPVGGNAMAFPRDETTPWGSDGVRAYWEAEADQATQTKPAFGRGEMRLHKLFVLVPLTDELLDDTTALSTHVERKGAESIRWKINLSIMSGTGAGQPNGIHLHASQVSIAKETSQTADTVETANVAKMFAQNTRPGMATWVMNQNVFPQIITMTVGNSPIWTPPNAGLRQTPAGNLLGRPIVMSQTAQTLGDKGDIHFIDFGQYKTITKSGGIQMAQSMHLWFDYDTMAFRLTFRVDGQPWPTGPVVANIGTNFSPFITLDERGA